MLTGLLALSSLASPFVGEAQRIYRIGVITPAEVSGRFPQLLRQNLRDLGYVEGRNLVIEWRPGATSEQFDELAVDLVRLNVEVIVATVPGSVFAAKRATRTIPIVMVNTPDPVQLGLVASLARPAGNITGTTSLSADVSIKQLELLKEAVPKTTRVAIVWNPTNPWHPLALKGLDMGARSLAVQLQPLPIRAPQDFDKAFEAMIAERAGATLVLADPMTFEHRARLANLAARHRLPSMYGLMEHVEAGGLMSYWADTNDLYPRVAGYVDRILKGAKPGELPIQQPTKFELVINLKTAKALGLTIPPSLLARADRVVQ